MGRVVAGVGKGGVRCSDVGNVLCHGGLGGTSAWVGDVGYVPTQWEDAGRLPSLGSLQNDGTAA